MIYYLYCQLNCIIFELDCIKQMQCQRQVDDDDGLDDISIDMKEHVAWGTGRASAGFFYITITLPYFTLLMC